MHTLNPPRGRIERCQRGRGEVVYPIWRGRRRTGSRRRDDLGLPLLVAPEKPCHAIEDFGAFTVEHILHNNKQVTTTATNETTVN